MTQTATRETFDATGAVDHYTRPRYTAFAQAMHWLTAALMLAILPIAWHMTMLARDNPVRETWYTVHKSIGLTILALSVMRILWRIFNPPPPLPGRMGRIETAAAHVSHWLLYVVLFVMPISGYLLSSSGGRSVSYLGLVSVPALFPPSQALGTAARNAHELCQWAVYGLILLHLAATAWHVLVPRNGILDRMLPLQRLHD